MGSTACRLCGAEAAAPFLAPKDRLGRVPPPDIVKCTRCGLVYAAQRPAAETLIQQYDHSYYADVLGSTCTEGSATAIAGYFDSLLKQIESYHPRGRLLDLGCATGDFLVAAQKRGWVGTGVEVSRYAAQQARGRGLNVMSGSLEAVAGDLDLFDVVTLWEVLEHLSDPLVELGRVRKLLAPGGLLALSTPNVYGLSTALFGRRSVIFKPSEHLFYFSRQTLSRILAAAGFRVVVAKSHLVLLTNFLLAWQSLRLGPQNSLPVSRIAPAQKNLYGMLFHAFHGTRIGTMGVALANQVLDRLDKGDGFLAFAEVAG